MSGQKPVSDVGPSVIVWSTQVYFLNGERFRSVSDNWLNRNEETSNHVLDYVVGLQLQQRHPEVGVTQI